MQRVLLCVQVYTSLQALRCPVFVTGCYVYMRIDKWAWGQARALSTLLGASHPLELQQQRPLTQGPGGKYSLPE